MIGSIIGGALGLVGGALGSRANARESAKNRAFQENMMDKKYAMDRRSVADNRAYNSPEQVMARMRKAGLNPDMMYGQGVGVIQNDAMTAPAAEPAGNTMDVGGPLSSGFSVAAAAAQQADVNRSVANKNDAEAEQIRSMLPGRQEGQDLDNLAKKISIDLSKNELDISNETKDSIINLKKGEVDKLNNDIVTQRLNNILLQNEVAVQPQMLQQEFEKIVAEVAYTKILSEHGKADIAQVRAKTKQIFAETEAQKYVNEYNEEFDKTDFQVKMSDGKTKTMTGRDLKKAGGRDVELRKGNENRIQNWSANNPKLSRVIGGLMSSGAAVASAFILKK